MEIIKNTTLQVLFMNNIRNSCWDLFTETENYEKYHINDSS